MACQIERVQDQTWLLQGAGAGVGVGGGAAGGPVVGGGLGTIFPALAGGLGGGAGGGVGSVQGVGGTQNHQIHVAPGQAVAVELGVKRVTSPGSVDFAQVEFDDAVLRVNQCIGRAEAVPYAASIAATRTLNHVDRIYGEPIVIRN